MSDNETKVLCPKGSKVCPDCKTFVKGPRTKLCACGHVFFKSAGKPAKVTKPVKAVAVAVKGIDPYTFNLSATPQSIRSKTVVRRTRTVDPNIEGFENTLAYLENVKDGDNSGIPSDVTFVF